MHPLARGLIVLGACAVGLAVASNLNHKQTSESPSRQGASMVTTPPDEPAAPEKPLTPAEQKKLDALTEKNDEIFRVQYAKFTENDLLRVGYDVDVTAYGPKHKYLKLKWVLANKPLAFKFSEDNREMFATMKKQGFTKFEITDGFEFGWQWDLTK